MVEKDGILLHKEGKKGRWGLGVDIPLERCGIRRFEPISSCGEAERGAWMELESWALLRKRFPLLIPCENVIPTFLSSPPPPPPFLGMQ